MNQEADATYLRVAALLVLENIHEEIAHLLLRLISATIAIQWQIREQKVQRRKTTVQILVAIRESLVQLRTNLIALKRPRRRQNRDLRHGLEDVERAPFVNVVHLVNPECIVILHEVFHLLNDHADVSAEVLEGKSDLDELFLLHKNVVGDIVNHVLAKDWRCEMLQAPG